MSQAGEVAAHAAQICIGALSFASGAAGAISTISVSIAALSALGISRHLDTRRNSCQAAAERTLASLAESSEFSAADLERAKVLLDISNRRIKIDPEALRNGVEGGLDAFDARLAEHLMLAISFEPDDHAVRRAIELALTTAIRVGRRHPDIHRDLTQALLIEGARESGIQIALVKELGERMDHGFASIHEMLRTLQEQAAQVRIFENVLDFVVNDGGEFQLELSIMKDGKFCVFHNKPFKTEITRLMLFLEDFRIFLVSKAGTLREMGFPLKESMREHVRNQNQALMIQLDATGKAKEGFYIPLKVYD